MRAQLLWPFRYGTDNLPTGELCISIRASVNTLCWDDRPQKLVRKICIHWNNGEVSNECFVHCSEVFPSSDVEVWKAGGKGAHCREVFHSYGVSIIEGFHCVEAKTRIASLI